MIKLMLLNNYVYDFSPWSYEYVISYPVDSILYTQYLDCRIDEANTISSYIKNNYYEITHHSSPSESILLIEEILIEDQCLKKAIQYVREAGQLTCLTQQQSSNLINTLLKYSKERQETKHVRTCEGYIKHAVMPYPYVPCDHLQVYRYSTEALTSSEVCGLPVLMVIPFSNQNYYSNSKLNNKNQNRKANEYKINMGISSEEAMQAVLEFSKAFSNNTTELNEIIPKLNHLNKTYNDSLLGKNTINSVKNQRLQQHRDAQPQLHAEGAATYAVCSIPTAEDKPVCLAYEGKDTDTQQHSDTHTQQEDSTVDTYTLLHNDVVYDTLDIDTYIHTAVDTITLY